VDSIAVALPDGATILSTHTGLLQIPGLPASARLAHIFPSLQSNSLLSIGQLCDHGCSSIFTNNAVTTTLHDLVVLTGTRSSATGGLWTLDPLPTSNHPLPPDIPSTINGSVNAMFHTTLAHNNIAAQVAFYHASLFSPTLSTWCANIVAGHFTTWPGLTSAAVRKYPPHSMAMHQGHLDQVCMNSSSTQPRSPLPPVNPVPDHDTSPPEPPTIRSGTIYIDCQCTTGMIYTDPTGKFITPSVSGNQYILIVYEYDGNYIYGAPMPDRTGPSIIAAYKTVIRFFES
jgi:hypothetical protein